MLLGVFLIFSQFKMISNPAIENKSIKQNKIKVMFHCRKLNTLACSNCPLAISQAHTAVPVLPEKKIVRAGKYIYFLHILTLQEVAMYKLVRPNFKFFVFIHSFWNEWF